MISIVRHCCAVAALGLLLIPTQLLAADADAAKDPVKAFQQALAAFPGAQPTPARLKAWGKKVEEAAKALTRVDHLCRAVELQEWGGPDDEVGMRVREALGKRLVQSARVVFAKGSPSRQQALLVLIADAAKGEDEVVAAEQSGRPAGARTWSAIFPTLKKDVIDLAREAKAVSVRLAAVRALAHLRAKPAEIALLVQRELKATEAAERRVAAGLLNSLLQPLPHRPLPVPANRLPLPVKGAVSLRPPGRLQEQTEALVPLAVRGARDKDTTVRRLCLAALGSVAEQLGDEVGALRRALEDVVPELENARQLKEVRQGFKEPAQQLASACKEVNRALPIVLGALKDEDVAVCLAAHKTLRNAATVRLRWGDGSWLVGALEEMAKSNPLDEPVKAVPALTLSLKHKEVRIRLAALYVLETLTAAAAPAAAALADRLGDDNRFVRWGAARALRNMAPAGAARAVPALAKVLADDSADVRNTAAVALERYTTAAKPAVAALSQAVKTGDARLRFQSVRALGAIGKEASEAEGTLRAALADEQANVRAAAADALGRLGTLDKQTRTALTRMLADEDQGVRQAAAAALLREDE
jgi:HEAT repeat protein